VRLGRLIKRLKGSVSLLADRAGIRVRTAGAAFDLVLDLEVTPASEPHNMLCILAKNGAIL
jgi:hypothetical protein